MSASHKKQLRKEQKAAQMTEKQQAAAKEAKQLKLYTFLFTAIIIMMVAIAVVTTVVNSGVIERSTTAVTVDDAKISAVELNYYYIDAINNYLEQWGDYVSLTGIDTTKPLDEQIIDQETGTTWADSFVEVATENIHAIYSVYNKAVAEGCTLSEEDAATIDSSISTMELYAMYYGYSDVDSYLKAVYGKGANLETYRHYAEVQMIASAYANTQYEALTYTAEDLAAYLAENPKNYTSYSYNYYYLSVNSFLQGGTQDEDGVLTYSDEERAAAIEACKAAAEALTAEEINDVVLLDKAIKALDINLDNESAASTAVEDRMYTSLTSLMKDWISDENRVPGDVGMVASESTSTDTDGNEVKTVTGYYVMLFNGSDDNTYTMNSVRHILVAFEGGTTDEDGNTVYSDEEKAAAKAEAEEILAAYLAGEQTEEAFTALVYEHSDDVDTYGEPNNEGLYENIIPSSGYVENFLNWAIDDARTPGETGIVETEYGYHIMFFVCDSELSYRDTLITEELRDADMLAWETALMEASTLTVKNTRKVNTSLTLSAG